MKTIITHYAEVVDGVGLYVDNKIDIVRMRSGRYQILGPDRVIGTEKAPLFACDIRFRAGDTPGLTVEALLAVVQDRLEDFQQGPFPCPENQDAIGHVKAAMAALHKRTLDRRIRNVNGKAKP